MKWKLLSLPAAGLAAITTGVAGSLGLVAAAKADEKRIGFGRPTASVSRESREAGHELKDLNARGVGMVLGTIMVSYAILIGFIFFMVHYLSSQSREAYARFTPQQTARIVTPAPHLQEHPVEDYREYRRKQLARLYHYDKLGGGFARIPIPRAMALELGHGLDAPADAGAAPGGAAPGGGGNSGKGGGNAGGNPAFESGGNS